MKEPLAITGRGVVSSAGSDLDALVSAIAAGARHIDLIDDPRISGLRATMAGTIPSFDESFWRERLGKSGPVDRHVLLACCAMEQALAEAGCDRPPVSRRCALVFATCSGPMVSIEQAYAGGCRDESFGLQYYSAAHILAQRMQIRGPVLTVTTACSASLNALGCAADLIDDDLVDMVVVCGSDAFSMTTLAGFDGLKATVAGRCAPFSYPTGMNLGEGAACVVCESAEAVRRRNVAVRLWINGYGTSNDAYHPTTPDPGGRGAALSIGRALEEAGIEPGAIGYVNAHGTGTEANDKAETRALRRALGSAADTIPVSSLKGVTGHTLGAAGLIELLGAEGTLARGTCPATAGFDTAREGCSLDYVSRPGREWHSEAGVMLKNNFAFGGNNASVVVTSPVTNRVSPGKKASAAAPVVSIAGLGLLTPLGSGVEPFETSGIPRDYRVPPFDPRRIDRRLDLRNVDRETMLSACAATTALQSAGLRPGRVREVGLFMHMNGAPRWAEEAHITTLLENGLQVHHVSAFPYIVPNSTNGSTSRILGLTGHNGTFCFGPGGALFGLCTAVNALKNGRAGLLLSGAVDTLLPGDGGESPSFSFAYGSFPPAESAIFACLRATAPGTPLPEGEWVVAGTGWSTPGRGDDLETQAVHAGCSAVEAALDRAGIDPGAVSLVCGGVHPFEQKVLGRLSPSLNAPLFSTAHRIGLSLTAFPMIDLAVAMGKTSGGTAGSTQYILSFCVTPFGHGCAVVLSVSIH